MRFTASASAISAPNAANGRKFPNSLIDWDATEKFEQGRQQGKARSGSVELDKELEVERKAKQAVPAGRARSALLTKVEIFLLDTYENQPQLSELQQSGGDLEKNTKTNILRAAINPLAGVKQRLELPGAHAKIQSHTTVPSLYVNIDLDPGRARPLRNPPPASLCRSQSTDRFKIIRVDVKAANRSRSAQDRSNRKMKTDERFVTTTATAMTGGWVKLTPPTLWQRENTPWPSCWEKKESTSMCGISREPVRARGTHPRGSQTRQKRSPKTDQPAELQKRENSRREK